MTFASKFSIFVEENQDYDMWMTYPSIENEVNGVRLHPCHGDDGGRSGSFVGGDEGYDKT